MLSAIRRAARDHPPVLDFLAWIYTWMGRNSFRIRGKRNRVQARGAFLSRVSVDIVGSENTIRIGPGSRLSNTRIRVRGSHHTLELGEYCQYKSGSLWFEDQECVIAIGDRTTVEGALIKVTEPRSSIVLGKDCMLGTDIEIRTGDSHSLIDLTTGRRINGAQNVCLGEHVWLGAHVRVLKGVTIGAHSAVGTDSVVTQSVPGHCIAAGVPARVVRENITWARERIYDQHP